MGLVVYISRKPNQPAKSNANYDEDFWVATLSNIPSDDKKLEKKNKNHLRYSPKNFLENTVTKPTQ